MSEIRTTLECIERRVSMPEPPMERMLRRRERRQRNERIAAAVVGLGVFVAGVVGALLTLRVAGGTSPASRGGGTGAAAEGGGLVLPTVAIWTAIVVLGLTMFTAVRLRARFADVDHDVDVEQEGRGPGGAAASARRPAAAPGGAPREGGSEMDSKHKAEVVGLPRTEMPEIRFDDGKLRRTNRWLIGAVVVLTTSVVALGVAVIAQTGEEGTPTPPSLKGLASPRAVQVVDGILAALNTHDEEAFGALYATDAVVNDGGTEYRGRDEIVDFYLRPGESWSVDRTSEVVQGPSVGMGDILVSHAFTVPTGSGMLVYELDGELQVVRQWIVY